MVHDSDGGASTAPADYDRAMGPLQFLPGTWSWAGRDGDGDGRRDPQNVFDAALATADYLCLGGRDLSRAGDLRSAVLSYNQSGAYHSAVVEWVSYFQRHGLAALTTVAFRVGSGGRASARLAEPRPAPRAPGREPARPDRPPGPAGTATPTTTSTAPPAPPPPPTPAGSPRRARPPDAPTHHPAPATPDRRTRADPTPPAPPPHGSDQDPPDRRGAALDRHSTASTARADTAADQRMGRRRDARRTARTEARRDGIPAGLGWLTKSDSWIRTAASARTAPRQGWPSFVFHRRVLA